MSIELKSVTKSYKTDAAPILAVNNINLTVNTGEIILIKGPSGSGKTTLLSMMGGLLKPTSGEILVENLNIANLKEKDLAGVRLRNFGFIFQSFNLLASLTAIENVAYAASLSGHKNEASFKLATDMLSKLNLGHRLQTKPSKLSGGEKQRVAIARAMVNDPKFILADEPTANLDSKTGHDVMDQLRATAKDEGRSVIIVSHDDRIRSIADRILWLEDGKFKKTGNPDVDRV